MIKILIKKKKKKTEKSETKLKTETLKLGSNKDSDLLKESLKLSYKELEEIILSVLKETLPLPDSEKRKRADQRLKDTEKRNRDYEKSLDQLKKAVSEDSIECWLDDDEIENPLLAKPKDEAKKKKKNCSDFGKGKKTGANSYHHPETGEFTDKSSAGSWSLKGCKDSSSDVKKGQAKMKSGKELFTKVKCGRDEKYRCRDGSEKW